MKEKGIGNYEELSALAERLSQRFGELSEIIKADEKRMVEIGALQTHINNFDQLPGKKVPTRQSLHEEYNRLLTEKKKAYVEYRQVRKDMQEYLTAKQTVEHILGMDRKKKEEQQRKER